MYEYVRGRLVAISPTKAVVDVHGIGFSLEIPVNLYTKSPAIGEEIHLYTAHVVREDSERLFGFLSVEERELFLSCSAVSGIGPKTALNLVGHMDLTTFRETIQMGNLTLLCKIPGIGKKTAERLLVEMKGRLPKQIEAVPDFFCDATAALVHLGYNLQIAQKAVKSAMPHSEGSLSTLITKALQQI